MSAQANAVAQLILVSAETENPVARHRLVKTATRLVISDQGSPLLDAGQVGLDAAGLIPGVGEIFDGINALVSLVRGDYVNAALSLISMIPAAGDIVGKGGKLAIYLSKLSKQEGRLGKAGQAILKYGPQMKAALAQFSKFLVENRKQVLVALRTLTSVVQSVANPEAAEEQSPGLAAAVKVISKSSKLKAITAKAEPYMGKLNGAVLSMLQIAQASDDMFQKLEERAQAEAGAAE
jgi:CHASE3 domain sensor protein